MAVRSAWAAGDSWGLHDEVPDRRVSGPRIRRRHRSQPHVRSSSPTDAFLAGGTVSVRSLRRRLVHITAVTFVACGMSMAIAAPAWAADVGYIRMARYSPDCGMVVVYISPQTGATPTKSVRNIDYSRISDYFAMPAGPYAVALRDAGDSPDEKPELATQLTVAPGRAYTVVALGMRADLGARVLDDDLTMAAAGKARVRIVQAAAQTPFLNVSVVTGGSIAEQVAYASSTKYQEVDQGRFTVLLQQQGGAKRASVDASLVSGSVYTLFVLDQKTGLTGDLRVDALRKGNVPQGGVETGAGGSRDRAPAALAPIAAVLVVVGLFLARGRLRRRVPDGRLRRRVPDGRLRRRVPDGRLRRRVPDGRLR